MDTAFRIHNLFLLNELSIDLFIYILFYRILKNKKKKKGGSPG